MRTQSIVGVELCAQQALLLTDGQARGAGIMVKIQDDECYPASGPLGLGFGGEASS